MCKWFCSVKEATYVVSTGCSNIRLMWVLTVKGRGLPCCSVGDRVCVLPRDGDTTSSGCISTEEEDLLAHACRDHKILACIVCVIMCQCGMLSLTISILLLCLPHLTIYPLIHIICSPLLSPVYLPARIDGINGHHAHYKCIYSHVTECK